MTKDMSEEVSIEMSVILQALFSRFKSCCAALPVPTGYEPNALILQPWHRGDRQVCLLVGMEKVKEMDDSEGNYKMVVEWQSLLERESFG